MTGFYNRAKTPARTSASTASGGKEYHSSYTRICQVIHYTERDSIRQSDAKVENLSYFLDTSYGQCFLPNGCADQAYSPMAIQLRRKAYWGGGISKSSIPQTKIPTPFNISTMATNTYVGIHKTFMNYIRIFEIRVVSIPTVIGFLQFSRTYGT